MTLMSWYGATLFTMYRVNQSCIFKYVSYTLSVHLLRHAKLNLLSKQRCFVWIPSVVKWIKYKIWRRYCKSHFQIDKKLCDFEHAYKHSFGLVVCQHVGLLCASKCNLHFGKTVHWVGHAKGEITGFFWLEFYLSYFYYANFKLCLLLKPCIFLIL